MKEFFANHITVTSMKGMLGMTATGSGLYVSTLPEIEAWLRIISLCIGISVGIATFISIVRHKKKK
jgi:hypothetical protein